MTSADCSFRQDEDGTPDLTLEDEVRHLREENARLRHQLGKNIGTLSKADRAVQRADDARARCTAAEHAREVAHDAMQALTSLPDASRLAEELTLCQQQLEQRTREVHTIKRRNESKTIDYQEKHGSCHAPLLHMTVWTYCGV